MARMFRRIALMAAATGTTIWVLAGAAEAGRYMNHNETFGGTA